RERGWQVAGTELSRHSLALSRQCGLDVVDRTLEEAAFPGTSFDAVTANHVLEHVRQPESLLREIRRVLVPGGLLFVSVPNVHTCWFYVKGRRYTWTFQDDHFLHFSKMTLARLLAKHGFSVLEIETSRWVDFHDDFSAHGGLFRGLNSLAERYDLGIEILCLARKEAMPPSSRAPRERERHPRRSATEVFEAKALTRRDE